MTESRLSELQTDFCEYLLHGRHEDRIGAQLRPPSRQRAALRLDVYRNAYFIRLQKALAHDFPVTAKVLGEKAFARMATAYVLARSSRHPSIRYVGRGFPVWLRDNSQAAVGDLAAIEWAVMQTFDGPDNSPARPDALDGIAPIDWPKLEISLAPTLRILVLNSNADRVWMTQADEVTLRPAPTQWIAISRDSLFHPRIVNLGLESFVVMNALLTESRIAIVSERLSQRQDPDKLPAQVARALHIAFANDWVAGVRIEN